ncbi:hypothetical protein BASA50_008651 [Batrachochytrium salamandrivorans]|uniref:Extracellular metalloproteinase n=1 Tax=Batrachochytrium salamandrivorans TaxID=1357716 RepID=A0ABQ8F3I5_9FUNG|nr:hypothetical protein BASA50_008651 [Batrachochytrium salamandrivorans]KAH9274756.1 hypothetical protein BASA83_002961 [Batrachochytrium salamandrivorans]
MIAISFVLVLALVSSTVVAQPGTNGCTGLFSCFRLLSTLVSTEIVHEWIPPSEETPTLTSDQDPVKIGLSYILQKLDLQPGQFTSRTSFTDRLGVTHLYGAPLYKGSLIGDLHAAAHIKDSRVFFYSATTVINDDHALTKRSLPIPKSRAKLSSKKAVKAAVDHFKIPFYRDIPPVKGSYSTNDGDIPVWIFHLRDNPTTQWIEIKVNAITGDIVSKEDVKRSFTYTAIELPNKSPNDGFSTIVNPENFQASPNGWSDGYKLAGNNVLVKIEGGETFKTTIRGVFNGGFDPTLPPQTPRNIVAGVINAFYVANTAHDVFYEYGFTEKAGNFQQDNFGRGGIGGDPVIINLQGRKRRNYVSFDTPFDGHPGMLNLHIFTATEPNRDPALDNTVIVHELTHGLTTRLTGGAQTKFCVSGIESHGLNEGYSDMMAMIFMAKPEDTRNTKKVIGEYVQGNPRGMRRYPYTTDMKVNPLTYKDVAGEKDPHHLGAIWATMLLEVYCNLVDEYGFSANLHDATQEEGNIIFLQLFVGTLMIQPCEPTFESAYDAMLAADYAYYGGIHEHLIRKGFFKRGLGSIS